MLIERNGINMSAYDKVTAARKSGRPTGADYIYGILSGFIELHGDRRFADDQAIVGGIGYLGDIPVTALAIEKGKNVKDRIKRNFGLPKPEGYRKALRLAKEAEKFRRPVICFVDTAGAFCGVDAEERGQGLAIAENLMSFMTLKTPVISVITGEGGSGGALALAVADRIFVLENSIYSVISPEGCASILWKDSKKVAEAAECLHLTSADMCAFGIADDVISENFEDFSEMCRLLRERLLDELAVLMAKTGEELTEERYRRFRIIGTDKVSKQ